MNHQLEALNSQFKVILPAIASRPLQEISAMDMHTILKLIDNASNALNIAENEQIKSIKESTHLTFGSFSVLLDYSIQIANEIDKHHKAEQNDKQRTCSDCDGCDSRNCCDTESKSRDPESEEV